MRDDRPRSANQAVSENVQPFILVLFLLGAAILIASGGIAYFKNGAFPAALMLWGAGAAVAASGTYYGISGNLKNGTVVGVIACLALFLFFEIGGGVPRLAILWLPVIPLISFYTQGFARAIAISAAFAAGTVTVSVIGQLNLVALPYESEEYLVIFFSFGIVSLLVGLYQNSVEQGRKRLADQYTQDELTGLPNRTKLKEDLSAGGQAALMLINVDDFREINDLFGDREGDQTLAKIALRLNEARRGAENARLYKLHADEFAILIPGEDSRDNLDLFARRIAVESGRELVIAGVSVRVTVSVGIATGNRNLFAEADLALRAAKQGRQTHAFYDRAMSVGDRYYDNARRLGRIRAALASDCFVPYFQPILSNSTERVTKYECLARIRDGEGTAMPVEFLDISRRAKVYPEVTRRIFSKAFERFRDTDCEFSVNLSLDDILNPETVEFVLEWIDRADLGRNLIFELLETDRMSDSPEVFEFLASVRERGCRIAIDDFGSGYSNFDFVLRVRPDFLKIDASLVRRVADDENALLVVKTIVEFSKQLGVATVAEHVHERRVFDCVRELGIDYAQGHYVGKAEPEPINMPILRNLQPVAAG